jgi:hypothetical protein
MTRSLALTETRKGGDVKQAPSKMRAGSRLQTISRAIIALLSLPALWIAVTQPINLNALPQAHSIEVAR